MLYWLRQLCRTLSPRIIDKSLQTTVQTGDGIGLRSFHMLTLRSSPTATNLSSTSQALLAPRPSGEYTQTCGLKYMGKVHRRCRDCRMMWIAGVMHNFCKTHPRHKQKAFTKKPKNTWILTGVTQCKIRPW